MTILKAYMYIVIFASEYQHYLSTQMEIYACMRRAMMEKETDVNCGCGNIYMSHLRVSLRKHIRIFIYFKIISWNSYA